jgi:hypothetical protein
MLGCPDYLTGQLPEPQGPIQILKLTLFDASSRDVPVFTDTSLPDCTPVNNNTVDCSTAANYPTQLCQVCYLSVMKDMYSVIKSPPTPDSGQDMRVVFDKIPELLNGQTIANDDQDMSEPNSVPPSKAVQLLCPSCAGLPPVNHFLVVSGSDVTFDPTVIPYGPSLQMIVDTTDPRAALEPGTSYTVQVSPGVSGTDGNVWVSTPDQLALLNFTTEPFKVLSIGDTGGMADTWVYSQAQPGTYMMANQPVDAAVVLKFNASLYAAGLSTVLATATAVQSGGSMPVPITLGTNVNQAMSGMTCVQDSQRFLYIYPTMGTWPTDASEVDITIPASSLFDVVQGGTFGQGMHTISNQIIISVKLTTTTGSGYITIANAITASTC